VNRKHSLTLQHSRVEEEERGVSSNGKKPVHGRKSQHPPCYETESGPNGKRRTIGWTLRHTEAKISIWWGAASNRGGGTGTYEGGEPQLDQRRLGTPGTRGGRKIKSHRRSTGKSTQTSRTQASNLFFNVPKERASWRTMKKNKVEKGD